MGFQRFLSLFGHSWTLIRRSSSRAQLERFNHVDLLMELSGCSEADIVSYLSTHPKIYFCSESHIRNAFKVIKDYQILSKKSSEVLDIVGNHPITIQNRAAVLKEAGFTRISPSHITKYLAIAKSKVTLLKRKGYLEPDADVKTNFLNALNISSDKVAEFIQDSEPLVEFKRLVVHAYLKDVLEFPADFKMRDIALFRLNHKSLKHLVENIALALNDIGYTKTKVRNNPFLLYAHPDNTRAILEMPAIHGESMREILRCHPKILSSTSENMLEIRDHLKAFGVSELALYKCPEVFTLKSATVLERLENLKKIKYLSLRLHHPRILELIFYQKKALKRLKLLEESKLGYASINTIAGTQQRFERFYKEGSEKPRGSDIIKYLTSELNCQGYPLRPILNRHLYWPYVPLENIARTLNIVREFGFTNDDIRDNIYIVFYPAKKVAQQLGEIRSGQSTSNALQDKKNNCERSGFNQEIQLALYELEKEFNFSGEAVWNQ